MEPIQQIDPAVEQAREKFFKARLAIVKDYPVLYRAFNQVKQVVADNPQAKTMAVEPKEDGSYVFYYDSAYINSLNMTQCQGVIKHELLHIVLKHPLRWKQIEEDSKAKGEDPMKYWSEWITACDLAINQYIEQDLQGLPHIDFNTSYRVYAQNNEFKSFQAAEKYYNIFKAAKQTQQHILGIPGTQFKDAVENLVNENLVKQMKQDHSNWQSKPDNEEGQQKPQSDKGQDSSQNPKQDKKDQVSKGSGKDDGDDGDDGDDVLKSQSDREEECDQIADDLGLSNGQLAGKGHGTNSAVRSLNCGCAYDRNLWLKVLKKMTNSRMGEIHTVSTWKKPNRRYGIMYPGSKKEEKGKRLLVAVDVSGSVNEKLVQEFFTKISGLRRQFAQYDILVFDDGIGACHAHAVKTGQYRECGSSVSGSSVRNCKEEYKSGDITFEKSRTFIEPFKRSMKFMKYGGGTNFLPVYNIYAQLSKYYDGLVVFTDGESISLYDLFINNTQTYNGISRQDNIGTIQRKNHISTSADVGTSAFTKAVLNEFTKLRKSIVYIIYADKKDCHEVITHKWSAAHVVWMPYYQDHS